MPTSSGRAAAFMEAPTRPGAVTRLMSGVLEWWDNIRVFRMAEPLPGSPYLEIFRITRAATGTVACTFPRTTTNPILGT